MSLILQTNLRSGWLSRLCLADQAEPGAALQTLHCCDYLCNKCLVLLCLCFSLSANAPKWSKLKSWFSTQFYNLLGQFEEWSMKCERMLSASWTGKMLKDIAIDWCRECLTKWFYIPQLDRTQEIKFARLGGGNF